MITITDIAVQKAKEALSHEGKADWGIRIYIAGSGCCGPAYGMDIQESPEDGDKVIEKDGLKIFADDKTVEHMSGSVVDFISDGQSEGFVIKGTEPPSCKCGGGE